MKKRPADTPLAMDAVTVKTSKELTIDALIQASPSVLLLRDGELVLYRRTRSLLYQCRFKLADGEWRRFSTRRVYRVLCHRGWDQSLGIEGVRSFV